MLNSIHQVLDSLGISPQKRAIHIQFTSPILNDQVFLQRIDGVHALNDGLKAELLCLSTNATIQLKSFIGSQAAVDIVTERGELTRVTGIITHAQQGQSDGSLTLYKLTLEDPTALWKYRRNSRVFMNKSVVEIWEILFKEWQVKNPLFAASLSLDLSGLTKTYDVRPFVMQHNESDWDFLTRLLRSEGINWLIDEAQHIVPSTDTSIQAQKLRLIDANSEYQPLDRKTIRYHRSSAVEQYDSMTRLTAERSLQPNVMHIQRWQAEILEQEEGVGSVQSKHQHSEQYDNATLGLEQAWNYAPAWTGDLKGEDGVTKSGNQQVERLNQNLNNYYDAQSKRFIAQTTVRDAYVGYYFELNEHPEIDQHEGSDKSFLIVSKNFFNQNNLPKDLNDQINGLLAKSNWSIQNPENSDERQANQLILQRRHIPTTPAYNPQTHSPVTHPQRAKVVGPEGEEIYVDEWGRIKVRFLFTRSDDHSHDGGAGANNNDTDSAWIDVLTPWAGEGYGARFLPRVGEIVVIDFFNGDIDRPFVMGRIHEAQRHPTKFDNKGKLPDTKKLSGIRSKEVSGGGFGQLRFDDTPGQISTQLQSSHGASQLNLGKLSHPKDKAESEDRGEGFELRTDQWGALRAGQGLLVSTHKQDNAKGEHLDAEVAKKQLEGSQTNSKALSDIAKNQKTDEIESIEQLKDFASQIQQQIAKFEKALLLLSSPDGIALSTSEDIHISADAQINQIAGDSINISTQKNVIAHAQNRLSLFAVQSGLKAVAAQGKVEIQAQSDALDVLANKGITISSTEDRIEISSPKEIVITGASSQITLNGSGIFPKTGGKFQVNAGQHVFQGGASASVKSSLPPPPKRAQGVLELRHDYVHGEFVKGAGYTVTDTLGKVFKGKLDDKGFARVSGLATGSVKVLFDPDPRNPWDEASDFKRKVEWPNQNDVEGSIGIASGSKGLTETLKNDFKKLSQLAGNVKSVQQKIESVKKIKDQGAKALLPMEMEQVLGGSDGSKLSQSFVSQNSFMPSSQQSNSLRMLTQASPDKTAITKIQSPFETFV
ncbi:type VI secretion system Vgr family protein [Acinetobacter nosocomialis]|uniref:Type VI secretion system tip protein VgrG n=2 Tax=Acinetobacter nosocomialis TaxID=106654 RepID=A0A2L1VHS0_ACINO|nr:type VI secretion system Vgr family protein [Acinetobacter nosocomialis]ARG17516.1 type VI secretion system protein [Acinetobacter nosocomialis]AVF44789.1 type VI secretion system tip protein VgrG [Acinetobacter nosocomialis]MBM9551916.1 type VI secretion system tip protein VgrG [Acinetobacter nosocomialis]MBP1469810.1 type VI secretion system tip protein VgrG [Acinetobacter nosocomialis]MBP1500234.1 type VI secretion system tip protein VgrG [Acinetobacter nosocomialis]